VQLRAALDHAAAPELCANLDGLYRYVIDQLGAANLKLSLFPLADASRVMTTIGDGFRKAHESL
jgi:flagellin-specific chaperone FliS